MPRTKHLRLRGLGRTLGTIVIAACVALLATFAYNHLAHPAPRAAALPGRTLLAFGLLVGPVWLLLTRLRPARPRPAPWLATAASLVLFFTWLASDDAMLEHRDEHPLLRSDFPDAAETHALVLRYSKGVPGSLHDTVPPSTLVFSRLSFETEKRADALDFLSTQREAINARWEELAPLRAWFDELAAAPALGDLTADIADPTPAFKPLRAVAQTAAAKASLLALDGRRDEAVSLLLPVLLAGQKLELHARTLVRRMIAIVLQRQALSALAFVLDQGPLEEPTRAQLAAALRPTQDPAEGARLLVLSEYPLNTRLFQSYPPASPFYNPKATANQFGDFLDAQAEAAARRDFEAMNRQGTEALESSASRLAAKNAVGQRLIALALPAFSKVAESYWDVHNQRAALLARL